VEQKNKDRNLEPGPFKEESMIEHPHNIPYWQTQDKEEPEVIKQLTNGCENKLLCRVSARVTFTTMAATADHYNSEGVLIVDNQNERTVRLVCSTCWKAAEVEVKRDNGLRPKNIKLTALIPPKPKD
jgi:hypothetical protein